MDIKIMDEKKYNLIVDNFLESLKNPLIELLKSLEVPVKVDPHPLPVPSDIKIDDSVFTIPPLEDNLQSDGTDLGTSEFQESISIKTSEILINNDPIFDGILKKISGQIPERFRNSTLTDGDFVEIYKSLFDLNLPIELLKTKLSAFNLIEVPPSTEDLLSDDNFDYFPVYRMQELKFQVLKNAVCLNSSPPMKVIVKGVVRFSQTPPPLNPAEFMESEFNSISKDVEVSGKCFSFYRPRSLQKIDVKFINDNLKPFIRNFNEAKLDQKPRWFAEFGKFILSLKCEDGGDWFQYRSKFLECFKNYFHNLGLTIDVQSANKHFTLVKDCDWSYLEHGSSSGNVFNILVQPVRHKEYIIKGLALVSI